MKEFLYQHFSWIMYLIVFSTGIYRIYYGVIRIKNKKEDDRYFLIPDSNVQYLWRKLNCLDKIYGYFFILYGIFLIIIIFVNLSFLHFKNLNIYNYCTNYLFFENIITCLFFTAFFGVIFVRMNSPINTVSWYTSVDFGLNFFNEKKWIYDKYKKIEFKKEMMLIRWVMKISINLSFI